jgi:putative membrane protein
MKINFRSYISYKFSNSIFNGAITGSVFTVYALLEPSLFSIGGIVIAVGIFVVAKLYSYFMNTQRFFEVSLFTELLTLAALAAFLILPKSYLVAIIYFWIYQVIFVFGAYLIRVESYFLNKVSLLSMIDRVKQKGYIVGLFLSYLFYQALKYLDESEPWEQVWLLYTVLFVLQIWVTVLLLKAFRRLPA